MEWPETEKIGETQGGLEPDGEPRLSTANTTSGESRRIQSTATGEIKTKKRSHASTGRKRIFFWPLLMSLLRVLFGLSQAWDGLVGRELPKLQQAKRW